MSKGLGNGWPAFQVTVWVVLMVGPGNVTVGKVRGRLAALGGHGPGNRLLNVAVTAPDSVLFPCVVLLVLFMSGHVNDNCMDRAGVSQHLNWCICPHAANSL
jgi:hypothetical protein